MLRPFSLLTFCLFIIHFSIEGQSNIVDIWQPIDPTAIPEGGKRVIQPNQFTTYQLDQVQLQSVLAAAPMEGTMPLTESPAILSVPLPTGEEARFRIVTYELFEPGLQTKYPEIRAYYGRGLEDTRLRIRLDWTEVGFRAMLHTNEGLAFIDPYAQGDIDHYVAYYKRNYPALMSHLAAELLPSKRLN